MLKTITGVAILSTANGSLSSALTAALRAQGIKYDLKISDLNHNHSFDAAAHFDANNPRMETHIYVAKKDAQKASALLQNFV